MGVWVLPIKSFVTIAVAENYMYRCFNFSHVNGKRGVLRIPNSRYIELNELEIHTFLLIQAQD